jgi:hypothetical protein
MAAATPGGPGAPPAPGVADARAAGLDGRAARWQRLGLLVIGLLTVVRGLLVMSLRPAAVATIVVLAAGARGPAAGGSHRDPPGRHRGRHHDHHTHPGASGGGSVTVDR